MIIKFIRPGEIRAIDSEIYSAGWDRDSRPKFNNTIIDLVENAYRLYRLNPEEQATEVNHTLENARGRQVIVLEYDGCSFDQMAPRHNPGDRIITAESCKGLWHYWYTYHPEVRLRHFKFLTFHGHFNDVAKKLRSWFESVNGAPKKRDRKKQEESSEVIEAPARGISLPDFGSLADRVGLSDF